MDKPRKVKTFRELSCGKFQYTAESQYITFERLIILQIILDKNSTMADQYYLRFKEKIKKHGATENNNLTFRR
jgi:hypothetical protein